MFASNIVMYHSEINFPIFLQNKSNETTQNRLCSELVSQFLSQYSELGGFYWVKLKKIEIFNMIGLIIYSRRRQFPRE